MKQKIVKLKKLQNYQKEIQSLQSQDMNKILTMMIKRHSKSMKIMRKILTLKILKMVRDSFYKFIFKLM